MKRKRKPILGERLFVLNVGSAARNTPQTLRPVIVSKVGRKYFTVENEVGEGRGGWKYPLQFNISDWIQVTEYSPDYVLYETEQELADERESRELSVIIRSAFECTWKPSPFPLETLRKIHALIKPETK
jgi:hypothetical protein